MVGFLVKKKMVIANRPHFFGRAARDTYPVIVISSNLPHLVNRRLGVFSTELTAGARLRERLSHRNF